MQVVELSKGNLQNLFGKRWLLCTTCSNTSAFILFLCHRNKTFFWGFVLEYFRSERGNQKIAPVVKSMVKKIIFFGLES